MKKDTIPPKDISVNSAISSYTISPLSTPKNGVVAVVSATFFNALTVNSITINQSQKGNLYVRLPQKRTNQGNYIDVTHPLSSEARQNINDTILRGYENKVYQQNFVVNSKPEISAQNSVKYSTEEYGNNLARLDIVVNDMVVHNAKIVSGNNGEFLSMPSYKDKNGQYHSICTPTNSEIFKSMTDKAMEEYNTEYRFANCDDNQISALKSSNIPFTSRVSDTGENIIKFKADNAQQVFNTINSVATAVKK